MESRLNQNHWGMCTYNLNLVWCPRICYWNMTGFVRGLFQIILLFIFLQFRRCDLIVFFIFLLIYLFVYLLVSFFFYRFLPKIFYYRAGLCVNLPGFPWLFTGARPGREAVWWTRRTETSARLAGSRSACTEAWTRTVSVFMVKFYWSKTVRLDQRR